MRKSTSLFLAFLPILPTAWGQCEGACFNDELESRLSECSLPPLTTDWEEFQHIPKYRNLSKTELLSGGDSGPSTQRIANYAQAECLCADGLKDLSACAGCLIGNPKDKTPQNNRRRVSEYFIDDCNAFGYYTNSTLSYPSTTRESMPLQTGLPDSLDDDCGACSVLHGQIEECDLTPLDTDEELPIITVESGPHSSYMGHALLNRTAAECLCTLPVLRRFNTCRLCTVDDHDIMEMVDHYKFDCNALGYWPDSQVVERSESGGSGGDASTPGTQPEVTSNPSAPDFDDAGYSTRQPIGLISAVLFSTFVWLLVY